MVAWFIHEPWQFTTSIKLNTIPSINLMSRTLQEYLTQRTALVPAELEPISACFKHLTAKKNEILIHQDTSCKRLYFINTGCLRVVCHRDDGQEWTRQVAVEQDFITIFPSFLEQTPSASYLQTVEASDLQYISYDDFTRLKSIVPQWAQLYHDLIEQSYVNSIRRIEKLITLNGKDLYEEFKSHHPDLLNRLPNKITASYLGISPETLSRLKTKK